MIGNNKFIGKVTKVSPVREFSKGKGIGFQLDNEAIWLNILVGKTEIVPFIKEDMELEGEYEQKGEYLNIKLDTMKVITHEDGILHKNEPFQQAGLIEDIDSAIASEVSKLAKINEELSKIKYLGFKDEDARAILITIYLSLKGR